MKKVRLIQIIFGITIEVILLLSIVSYIWNKPLYLLGAFAGLIFFSVANHPAISEKSLLNPVGVVFGILFGAGLLIVSLLIIVGV